MSISPDPFDAFVTCKYSHSWDGKQYLSSLVVSRSDTQTTTGSRFCFIRKFPPSRFDLQILTLPRTTYVGQVMAYEQQTEPDKDVATRTGEFAMLIYSIGTSLYRLAVTDTHRHL